MSLFDRFLGAPNIQKMQQRGDLSGLLKAFTYNADSTEATRRFRRQVQEAVIRFGAQALEPTIRAYLYPNSRIDPRLLLVVLREIGRRDADPQVRQVVARRLIDLMDLRKEHRKYILQALFSLACCPNVPTFAPEVRDALNPWLEDPALPLRAEATLVTLVTGIPLKDFPSVERSFDQLTTWSIEQEGIARRTAAALGEAAPILTESYFQEKAVNLLFRLSGLWPAYKPLRESITRAFLSYPLAATSRLAAKLAEKPKDTFASKALVTIGRDLKDGPKAGNFLAALRPYLDHPDWEIARSAANVLISIPWNPTNDVDRAMLLVTTGDFSMSSWSSIHVTGSVVERLAAVIQDPRYPASAELIRHLADLPLQVTDREARFRLRSLLAKSLVQQPPPSYATIVRGLTLMDYQPGGDGSAAVYWLYHHDWEKAAEIGAPAVDALMQCLFAPEAAVRRAAAQALISIYRSGAVDSQTSERILAVRGQMELPTGPLPPIPGSS